MIQNIRLKSLYALLEADEKRAFTKWLAYRLGDAYQDIQQLNQLIENSSDKQAIWTSIYPRRNYNDSAFRRLCNRLKEQLGKYLANKAFQEQTIEQDIMLIKSLSQRKAPLALFQSEFNSVAKRLNNQPLRNGTYFRYIYELERLHQAYLIKHPPKNQMRREQAIGEALDMWMLHEKLLAALMNLSLKVVHDQELNTPFLKEAFLLLENKQSLQKIAPLLYIYQRLLQLLESQSDDGATIWLLALEYQHCMEMDELKNILTILLNYHTQKANKNGTIEDYQRLLELYEDALEQQLLLIDGHLPPTHYKNIINVILRLLEAQKEVGFTKARTYIERLKVQLPIDEEEVYHLVLGSYYYFMGDFRQARACLIKKFNMAAYEVQARMYMLQMQYEHQGESDSSLEDGIRNLKTYIRRQNRVSSTLKQAWLNRLSIFGRLLKTEKYEELQKLLEKVKNTLILNDRSWLHKMIKEKLTKRLGGKFPP